MRLWHWAALLSLALPALLPAAPLLDFPTDNRAIVEGHPEGFFMYVNRDFEGNKSSPWQGGQFGFVRGPVREGDKVVYIQLHEGVDISPTKRDAAGNPLDPVRAAAAGRIAHISPDASASNYGRYVVVEHVWNGSPYYTLYAHLSSIAVQPGQTVRQGQTLGQMGFTGAGIDRPRAHCHFEFCLMLNRNFPAWHDAFFPGNPNRHSLYNGLNLVGADPARLLIESARNPSLDIRDYISTQEATFKIAVKNSPNFDLIKLYPWLVPAGQPANPSAWAVSLSRHGLPVKIEALTAPVATPSVVWVKSRGESMKTLTKGYVSGTATSPRLTENGTRFAKLLTWPDP